MKTTTELTTEKPESIFKINIKKNKTEVTDYLKFDVGDLVVKKYGSRKNIYQVTNIERSTVLPQIFEIWKDRARDHKRLFGLLNNYKMNNDGLYEGICLITFSCIIRNGKKINAKKSSKYFEFEIIPELSYYNAFTRFKITDLVDRELKIQTSLAKTINTANKRIQTSDDFIKTLLSFNQ